MGLFLTLLYILTAYLGPETLWGPIAQFHIEIILAGLATIASLHGLQRSRFFTIPQTYALVGMCVAVFFSMLFTGWFGSIPGALLGFIPNAFCFFLVVVNFRTKRHLQFLIATFLIICLFTTARGYMALRAGNYLSPYLIAQGNDEGVSIYRLRGLAFINDPNDFAQVIVSLIPLIFFFRRKGSGLFNLLLLGPVSVLIYGMYLTHSRGGMVAMLAVVLFAFRRKIGTIPASIIAGVMFAVGNVLGWSGGRDVSAEAGAGRMEAWAVGLDLIKSHPIFGVGFQRFSEYFFITAHNTVIVCAAELGMFGLFWWVMFVLPTLRDAYVSSTGKTEKVIRDVDQPMPYEVAFAAQREPVAQLHWQPAGYTAQNTQDAIVATGSTSGMSLEEMENIPLHLQDEMETLELPPEEIQRIASLMLISLVGYFVAGWFLSRAYIMTLFIYGGMVQVIYQIALGRDLVPTRMNTWKIVKYSGIWSVGLILVVYLMLRIQHMMGIR